MHTNNFAVVFCIKNWKMLKTFIFLGIFNKKIQLVVWNCIINSVLKKYIFLFKIFINLDYFNMLILKIIFKNKKYYFNTFPSKNTLKKTITILF
jgi:hypothetical protein